MKASPNPAPATWTKQAPGKPLVLPEAGEDPVPVVFWVKHDEFKIGAFCPAGIAWADQPKHTLDNPHFRSLELNYSEYDNFMEYEYLPVDDILAWCLLPEEDEMQKLEYDLYAHKLEEEDK